MNLLKDIVVDEISSVDKSANPHSRVLLAKRDDTKGDGKMSDEAIKQTLFYKSAENCLNWGTPPTFSRADYHTAITKRAADLKRAGESDAQAFTRTITDDEIGKTIYRASKFASGPEVEPKEETKPEPKVLGPAHAKMQALARTIGGRIRARPRRAPTRRSMEIPTMTTSGAKWRTST